ncbi:MAG: universal stress protein [Myxococcota bacterium]
MSNTLPPCIVGFDGSRQALAASALARALSARTGATTILAHALVPGEDRAAAEALLAGEQTRYGTPSRSVLLEGKPATALSELAAREGAGLVAIGTLGRGAVGRALFGSVAHALLRDAPFPVLVAHDAPVEAVRVVFAAVDESESAARVVAEARRIAEACGASLAMAHVLAADLDLVAHPEAYGIAREAWEETLAGVRDRVFGPHRAGAVTGEHERLLFGWPADALRDVATAAGAEIVVTGRRGGSGRGVEHVWSVASRLASRGPFATLVV